jgi:hypothetical protein
MLSALFSTARQRVTDASELKALRSCWETDILDKLKRRASNKSLSARSRKHWRRLYWQVRLGLVRMPLR